MKYKLLCLDIDDTLITDGSNEMSSKLRLALKKASEKLYISFITARSLNPFLEFLKSTEFGGNYHVVENGAKILSPEGKILIDLHISHKNVQELISKAAEYYLECGLLTDNHWRDNMKEADPNFAVTGISFTCSSEKKAEKLVQIVENQPESYVVYHGKHWTPNTGWRAVLVFHKNATKGNGMKYIQKTLNISKEETIAVGDGATDISMFDVAGLKVAMENGEQCLKDVADIICPSVKKDGVEEMISKYILS